MKSVMAIGILWLVWIVVGITLCQRDAQWRDAFTSKADSLQQVADELAVTYNVHKSLLACATALNYVRDEDEVEQALEDAISSLSLTNPVSSEGQAIEYLSLCHSVNGTEDIIIQQDQCVGALHIEVSGPFVENPPVLSYFITSAA
jgi:hypothetical protein